MKFLNELNTDDGAERGNLNVSVGAEALNINTTWDNVKKMFVPQLLNSFNGATGVPIYSGNPQYRSMRKKRDKLVEYKKSSDLTANPTSIGKHVLGTSINPYTDYTGYIANLSRYSYNSNSGDHFGEISIVKPDGYRYQYGIPVYQNYQSDFIFSVNATTTSNNGTPTLGFDPTSNYANEVSYNTNINPTNYDQVSASSSNIEQNTDEFYQRNTLPAYASNYLLTAVYSPDYVDLTGDGPSNDDMGYYVKYNYQQINDINSNPYNWRTPYMGVFLSKGDFSNVYDDKESYLSGQKDIWYLHSIETKTHIAIFTTTDRTDGVDASNSGLTPGSHNLKKLECIDLYSQSDLANPIQSVHFSYNYSLCSSIPNSNVTGGGKLTLAKVSFSYLGNKKGQLSPYIFSYVDDSNNSANSTNIGTSLQKYYTSYNSNGGIFEPTNQPIPNAFFQNPAYSANNNDRWGNFKVPYFKVENGSPSTPTFSLCGTDDSPYVDQDLDYNHDGVLDPNSNGVFDETCADNKQRNYHASAWCLRQITLPSGGQINIDYEQDDYAYVQDQDVDEMVQIVSTGPDDPAISGNTYPAYPGFSEDIDNNTRIYFELKKDTIPNQVIADDINKYLPTPQADGSQHIYFKTLVELKSDLSFKFMARDYIEGYMDIVNSGTVTASGYYGGKLGFIDVSSVPISEINTGTCHPIRKAAWQHLKLKRVDLLEPSTNTLPLGPALLQLVISIFTDAEQVILGFYHSCYVNQFAKKLELDNHGKPSFIRLRDPNGHKKGGGHRVRRITYSDNWNKIAINDNNNTTPDTYGQEYSYLLTDGRSSGVASYEPLQGGEENPFKQPSRTYSAINGPIPFKSRDFYIEKPYGEKYYPSPSVGYSRVIVKNIDRTITPAGYTKPVIANKNSLTGISVTEFYTARDFPVQVTYTGVNPATFAPPALNIPLVGSMSWENRGYSQGYEIILNNMHGQLKSQATYAPMYFTKTVYGTNMVSTASAQVMVQYIYSTNAPYSSNTSNQLNNNVTVLDYDGSYRTALIGQSGEEFVDLKENSSVKDFSWATLSFDFWLTPAPPPVLEIPTFCLAPWPTIGYTERMFRSAVHNKVITQTGILTEVLTTKDGSTIDMKNLMYDATTGEPLLTTVTNNFNEPVYTYNKQAYWAYNSMGPAYQNYRYNYTVASFNTSSGAFTVNAGIASNFHLGDVVQGGSSQYWVTRMAPNTNNGSLTDITLTDRYGVACQANPGNITIIKSGYTNQQDLKMGHIVSLENPMKVTATTSKLFMDAFNYALSYNPTGTGPSGFESMGGLGCDVYGLFAGAPYECSYDAQINFSNCGQSCNANLNSEYDVSKTPFNFVTGFTISIWCPSKTVTNQPTTIPYLSFTFPINVPVNFLRGSTVSIFNNNQLLFQNNNYPDQAIVPFSPTSVVATLSNGTLPDYFYYKPSCVLLDSVLQSSAIHYTDQWNFPYLDYGNPVIDGSGNSGNVNLSSVVSLNPYRFGAAGIWRPLNNWVYIDKRRQGDFSSSHTQINVDGTYKLDEHDWNNYDRLYNPMNPSFNTSNSIINNPNWTFVSEITNYNPYGYVSEKVDALGVYSSILYGYKNSVKTAEASNSSYFETAFEGFEDYNGSAYTGPHGHVQFSTPGSLSSQYHTGYYSMQFPNNISLNILSEQNNAYTQTNWSTLNSFTPLAGAKYQLSFWLKCPSSSANPTVSCSISSLNISTDLGPIVDGWQKVDFAFYAPAYGTPFTIQISSGSTTGNSYIDDVRLQPFTSAMKTYVYDPKTLWLLSELDNRNYATFYNYDEEGQVVQVKKETEKGIVTVKTSRNNIRRNLNQ